MKYLIVFFLCMSSIFKTHSQSTDSLTFLIVKIMNERDNQTKANFCSLNIEKGNKYADDLYSLKPYRNVPTQKDDVYAGQKKKSPPLEEKLNYFINATEAINFLANRGWLLDKVFNEFTTELQSGMETNGVVYYPQIKSEPIYIFKKILR